jgi:hypothetical protein
MVVWLTVPANVSPLPIWLAVYCKRRTSRRIRAVYDLLTNGLSHVI